MAKAMGGAMNPDLDAAPHPTRLRRAAFFRFAREGARIVFFQLVGRRWRHRASEDASRKRRALASDEERRKRQKLRRLSRWEADRAGP
jgi:hypothetical protein